MQNFHDAVVLVTGANRGLGLAFARAFLAAGARKVYGGARDPGSVTLPGVTPVALDVTRPEQIEAAARELGDVTVLVNNAGISLGGSFQDPGALDRARAELETNFFGPLALSLAFAPVLGRNGGGAIVNVLSALSWLNHPMAATYSASKAAAWSLTNGLRGELHGQGTRVVALHVGLMDTDMAKAYDAPKAHPDEVVAQVLDALRSGRDEVLADETSRGLKRGLSAEQAPYMVATA
jgi:NAD(P)-dependent dehydrogenase (short-subunit alcohol dehydrogenase family)